MARATPLSLYFDRLSFEAPRSPPGLKKNEQSSSFVRLVTDSVPSMRLVENDGVGIRCPKLLLMLLLQQLLGVGFQRGR